MKTPPDPLLNDSLCDDPGYQQFREALRRQVCLEVGRAGWRRRAQRWLAVAACLTAAAFAVVFWGPALRHSELARKALAPDGPVSKPTLVRSNDRGLGRVVTVPLSPAMRVSTASATVSLITTTAQGLERIDDQQLLRLPFEGRAVLLTFASGDRRLLVVAADGEEHVFGP